MHTCIRAVTYSKLVSRGRCIAKIFAKDCSDFSDF